MPSIPNTPILSVCDLSLSWDGKRICNDISLSVSRGEVVCLVGRSGTGKTTIFHAIAGLTCPDSGKVLYEGKDITGIPGHISYMLQKDLLMPELTIIDNVSLPLRVQGTPKRAARKKAAAYLPDFGLDGTAHLYPSQLSGGMRQRAALLRTYLMGNDVMLMDEPFSALDAFTRADMRQWVLRIVTELSISTLLITHDVDEAIALGDRVLVLAGAPELGIPSKIVGDLPVRAPRDDREGFMLDSDALALKREILALIKGGQPSQL